MENYPDIQRRDGTLFFACPEFDKGAIATSIERLIDLLDAMEDDPDLEPSGDELDVSASDGWKTSYLIKGGEFLPHVFPTDDDEEEPSGFGDVEGMNEDLQGEANLGWTSHIDQEKAHLADSTFLWSGGEGEPELGWCGNGIGWRESEGSDDREGDDEKDWDAGCPSGGDHGIADADSLHSEEWGFGSWPGDGSGNDIADDLIRGLPIAAKRAAAYMALGPN